MSSPHRLVLCLALAGAGPALAQPGALVIAGGGERTEAVLDTFVALAGRDSARVVVVPYASAEPDSAGARLAAELRRAGAGRVNVAPAPPDHPVALELLRGATGVFIAGGDQNRLMRVLTSTAFLVELERRYAAGVVMGGTSAGAAAMSEVMITGDERGGDPEEPWSTIRAGRVGTAVGLGLLEWGVVDQHFIARRRHNRLLSVILERPGLVGIGIDEATAIVVAPDGSFGVVGDGAVAVYDAWEARGIAADADGDFGVADVRLHLLTAGRRFDSVSRVVIDGSRGGDVSR